MNKLINLVYLTLVRLIFILQLIFMPYLFICHARDKIFSMEDRERNLYNYQILKYLLFLVWGEMEWYTLIDSRIAVYQEKY